MKPILEKLCNECKGVCCAYDRPITIQPEERDRLEALGALIQRNMSFTDLLMMPSLVGCRFLKEGRCSIYEERPEACKQFDCRTCSSRFFFQDNPKMVEFLKKHGITVEVDYD